MVEVFGTIVAKPELPYARVLARSFRRRHPQTAFVVLLTDEIEGRFEPAAEPFELLSLSDLDIPDPRAFPFLHERLPLSYAATPYFLAALLDRGADRAVFLKQESLVQAEQTSVRAALDEHPIVLTPHLLAPPVTTDAAARELNILLSGTFNGGVVGVRESATARRFLSWWADRVHRRCRHAVDEGMHYEQRWLDLVPAYFPEAGILREPAANVGHWNLPERRPSSAQVLRFSGFDPEEPTAVTRYSARVTLQQLGDDGRLFPAYARALKEEGWDEARRWPYAYDRFENGVAVPALARELFAELGDQATRFGNPFSTGPGTFHDWLQAPVAPSKRITRLWATIHERRIDLQRAFPDPLEGDEDAFAAWTATSGLQEHAITSPFLPAEVR